MPVGQHEEKAVAEGHTLGKEKKDVAMVVQTFNPSTQETDACRSLSLRLAWSIQRMPGQSGRQSKTLPVRESLTVGLAC